MDLNKRLLYSDKSIKFGIGNIEFNIANINYEPPIPDRYFDSHFHTTYELHYIPKGEGILKVNNKQIKIQPQMLYITGPGIFHEQISDSKNPMIEYCINFEFRRTKSNPQSRHYFNSKEMERLYLILKNTVFWVGTDEFEIGKLFELLYSEIDQKLLGYYSNIQSLCSQIIVNTARSFSLNKIADYDIDTKQSYDKRRIIMDAFFRHYDRPLKPSSLASLLGVSNRQLDRILKLNYNKSFKQIIIFTRMEISRELLKDTDMTVKDIALKVGFSSLSFFYKVFFETNGKTPSDYRFEFKQK